MMQIPLLATVPKFNPDNTELIWKLHIDLMYDNVVRSLWELRVKQCHISVYFRGNTNTIQMLWPHVKFQSSNTV